MTSQSVSTLHPFEPGTTGWTAADLDDPHIESEWMRGAYEIVDGVLTTMPPAYFDGSNATFNLLLIIKLHARALRLGWRVANELDIVVDDARVARADGAVLTPDEGARQAEAARAAGRPVTRRTRILIPPILVIESLSPGHEYHDRHTKRRWYAEFGIKNYWLLDAFARSLQCLVLDAGEYREDASGAGEELVRPSILPGLVIPLKQVWED
ncbi:MAG TPA: Uma2 family endonuclease [Tepidisphaeraceae bacterium]|jgi:Uma2 family endonuclease|nr:Uma2 family endonuclease [Tepidisphaeraceae bacterium]